MRKKTMSISFSLLETSMLLDALELLRFNTYAELIQSGGNPLLKAKLDFSKSTIRNIKYFRKLHYEQLQKSRSASFVYHSRHNSNPDKK